MLAIRPRTFSPLQIPPALLRMKHAPYFVKIGSSRQLSTPGSLPRQSQFGGRLTRLGLLGAACTIAYVVWSR